MEDVVEEGDGGRRDRTRQANQTKPADANTTVSLAAARTVDSR